MKIKNDAFWTYYIEDDKAKILDIAKVGKWMYFFTKDRIDFVKDVCQKSVENGIVAESKHTSLESFGLNPNATTNDSGVACFYLNIDDIEGHKKVISFFMENDMIRKTKAGKYYNISFKLDNQTRAGEYGDSFSSVVKLSDLMDLSTGDWIVD